MNLVASKVANGDVNFESLPPFLRVLLTTDGTVTKSLEAYFWEPVKVHTTDQQYTSLSDADETLGLAARARVLHRQVQLTGVESKRVYAMADSFVRTELLPESVRTGLEAGDVGIGELLRECGLETYREILGYGQSKAPEACVWRSYLISMDGRPFIKLKEVFPLASYQSINL